MIGAHKNELKRFNEAVQMYLDGRRDGTPDAILVGLADEVIEATADFTSMLWEICQTQGEIIRMMKRCKRDSTSDKTRY